MPSLLIEEVEALVKQRYCGSCLKALHMATLAAFLVLPIANPATAAVPALFEGQELPSLAPMLEQVTPAVVNISTRSRVQVQENPLFRDPFFRRFFEFPEHQAPQQRRGQSLGSGVVVDAEQGYVITNHHVIDKADEITVTLDDGRSFKAELIGADPDSDVAVVRIPSQGLTSIDLGDSDVLRVGDFVVAIGNPFGLSQTVTSGIVSALGRSGLGIEGYEDFIQTDASINPGNSGGALVNLRGELVGVNTAILAPGGGNVGIGFAIPMNMVRDLMRQIVEHGGVQRGRLGVYIQDLTSELAQALDIDITQGAVIAQVIPGSPAEQAGLEEGDVVTAVNGKPTEGAADLRNAVGLLRVGEEVKLNVIRGGEERVVGVQIQLPVVSTEQGGRISPRLEGSVLQDANSAADSGGDGVLVVEVEEGSPAWEAGLRNDDVILSVNRQPVRNLRRMREAIKLNDKALLLNIQRGEGALFLVIR